MVTSLNVWKVLEWDEKLQNTKYHDCSYKNNLDF